MAEIETLTKEERSLLDQAYDEGYRPVAKALRIIDAQRGRLGYLEGCRSELTRERDEALQLLRTEKRCNEIHVTEKHRAESEVTRLTEALALMRDCSESAEARVGELEERVARASASAIVADTQLAAANALLQLAHDEGVKPVLRQRIQDYLSAQPAARDDGRCVKCFYDVADCQCQPAAPTDHDRAVTHRNGSPVRSKIAREMLDQLHYQGACNTQEDDLERWAFAADALAEAITLRTVHERAVLDAMAGVPIQNLRALLRGGQCALKGLPEAASAELARREAKRNG